MKFFYTISFLFYLFFPIMALSQEENLVSLDCEKSYRIQSASSFTYLNCSFLYSGASITQTIYSSDPKSGQLWKFIMVSNGCYRIQSQYSGLYLTCSYTGAITQEKYSYESIGRQLWKVMVDRERNQLLLSVQTRLYLTFFRKRDSTTDTTKEVLLGINIIQPEGSTQKYTPEYQKREERKSTQYWKIISSD
ncbi:MAG: RICIN domain-containing protein [Candidatus Brocadiae bacterium]|nr:RICIN domain-containing protein [Candidatus Brocadiia bacterium]